ncbi:hypothetical protein K491DRAFT_255306 [Lophiostoma macrostomum CBS 122681]|uniref:Uncharacterized protein n=1 Tax=Lophiostoma macrostomum CBS 122681 TaxID=1314788 RepID=A0A6A6SNN3_9PLEO|nr:hypothetical protein K491DRAFT_255306 [Lophiostoma macrostomum CBS 122681]
MSASCTNSTNATRTCPEGHVHEAWPTSGAITIEKCERLCHYCDLTVKNDASTLRKHVILTHKTRQNMPIEVLQSSSGRRKRKAEAMNPESECPIIQSSMSKDTTSQLPFRSDSPVPIAEAFLACEYVDPRIIEHFNPMLGNVALCNTTPNDMFSATQVVPSCGPVLSHGRIVPTSRKRFRKEGGISRSQWTHLRNEVEKLRLDGAKTQTTINQLIDTVRALETRWQEFGRRQKCQEAWINILSSLMTIIGALQVPGSVNFVATDCVWSGFKYPDEYSITRLKVTIQCVSVWVDFDDDLSKDDYPMSIILGIDDHYWTTWGQPLESATCPENDSCRGHRIRRHEPTSLGSWDFEVEQWETDKYRELYEKGSNELRDCCEQSLVRPSVPFQNLPSEDDRPLPVLRTIYDLLISTLEHWSGTYDDEQLEAPITIGCYENVSYDHEQPSIS